MLQKCAETDVLELLKSQKFFVAVNHGGSKEASKFHLNMPFFVHFGSPSLRVGSTAL